MNKEPKDPLFDERYSADQLATWRPAPHYSLEEPLPIKDPDTEVGEIRFEREVCTLNLYSKSGNWLYDIDLYGCNTPQRLLSWCFHLIDRYPPEVIGGILYLVHRLIRETAPRTAEHYYCYRRKDDGVPDGFNWKKHHERNYVWRDRK